MMRISMIACVTSDMCIGFGGKLLISIKPDMDYFKRMTLGHVVVMGRNTYDTLSERKPLTNRTNVIISRTMSIAPDGFQVYNSVKDFMEAYKDHKEEIFVIGGAAMYDAFMPYADKIYLTHIHLDSISLITRMHGEIESDSIAAGTKFPKSVCDYSWDFQRSPDECYLSKEFGLVRYNFLTMIRIR